MGIVQMDSFDRREFHTIYEASTAMQEAVGKNIEKLPTVSSLLEDSIGSFYKYSPQLKEKPEGPVEFLHKQILEKLMGMQQYNDLREFTRLDKYNSAVASSAMTQTVIEEIDEELLKQVTVSQQIRDQITHKKSIYQNRPGAGYRKCEGAPDLSPV